MGKNDTFDDGFSEIVVQPPSAGIGHNKGPEWLPVGSELQEKIETHYRALLERAKELIAKQGAFKSVGNEADLKRSTEYVAQLQEAMTRLTSAYDLEGAPYRTAQSQVRGLLGMPKDDLEAIKRTVEGPMTAYNAKVLREAREKREKEAAAKRKAEADAREAQRIADAAALKARQEAQRKIDDAAAKAKAAGATKPKLPPAAVFRAIEKADALAEVAKAARNIADDVSAEASRATKHAAAPAADLTRKRSPNAIQSGQEFLDIRNVDKALLDPAKIWPFIKTEQLEQALREYGRINASEIKKQIAAKKQPLTGVEFFINLRTNVRR